MVEILNTERINARIGNVFDKAKDHLIIASPYLCLNEEARTAVEEAANRGVTVTAVYRQADPDTAAWVKALPRCNVGRLESLQAEAIMNDAAAVFSSMGLREYGEAKNEHLGVFAWIGKDRKDVLWMLYQVICLINMCVKECGNWDFGDLDVPLRTVEHPGTYVDCPPPY